MSDTPEMELWLLEMAEYQWETPMDPRSVAAREARRQQLRQQIAEHPTRRATS